MKSHGRRGRVPERAVLLIPPDPARIEDRIPLSLEEARSLLLDLAEELGYTVRENYYDDKA